MTKFKTIHYDTSEAGYVFQEHEAKPIEIAGHKCFVFNDGTDWNISLSETGMCISVQPTKRSAILVATHRLSSSQAATRLTWGLEKLKSLGIKLPVNNQYNQYETFQIINKQKSKRLRH